MECVKCSMLKAPGYPPELGHILHFASQNNFLTVLTHNPLHSRRYVTSTQPQSKYRQIISCIKNHIFLQLNSHLTNLHTCSHMQLCALCKDSCSTSWKYHEKYTIWNTVCALRGVSSSQQQLEFVFQQSALPDVFCVMKNAHKWLCIAFHLMYTLHYYL